MLALLLCSLLFFDQPSLIGALTTDEDIIKRMDDAWLRAGSGTSRFEEVILIRKHPDGTYFAELIRQGKRRRGEAEFFVKGTIFAIVHTHPNVSNPRPSRLDREVADRLQLPVVTLSASGMFLYDPKTKETQKLKDDLHWLDRRRL